MFPSNPGIVMNTILQAFTVGSVMSCTGEPANEADIFPKKVGCMASQSKITITFVAADVTTQIPALKVWLTSRLTGLPSVAGTVRTPAAPDPGVPEQEPETTLKSLTDAFATPVPITTRRSTPAVPFTAVVVAVVIFAPEDPAVTS